MKKFFREHQEWFLAVLAVIFLMIFVWATFWSLTELVVNLDKAIGGAGTEEGRINFDLNGAQKINFKGLTP